MRGTSQDEEAEAVIKKYIESQYALFSLVTTLMLF
eukprot:SAG11_NODE_33814_length_275_cov_0.704545_1_plen_34_part_10